MNCTINCGGSQKWTVRYDGSDVQYFDDVDGMAYIHYLLERPNKHIKANDLYRVVHVGDSPDNLNLAKKALIDIDEGLDIVDVSSSYHDDDEENSLPKYLRALRELGQEEAEARRRGNSVELADARKRRDELQKLINNEYGAGGIRRAVSDPYKKPRQAISKAIKSVLKDIKILCPSLAQHFSDSIHKGTECYYTPDSDTTWTT